MCAASPSDRLELSLAVTSGDRGEVGAAHGDGKITLGCGDSLSDAGVVAASRHHTTARESSRRAHDSRGDPFGASERPRARDRARRRVERALELVELSDVYHQRRGVRRLSNSPPRPP